MNTTHEPFTELAAVYALCALDGEELVQFEAHLETGCAMCRRALDDSHTALVQVAQGLREAPPRQLRRAIIGGLGRGQASAQGRPPFWAGFRWAASVAVATGVLAAILSAFVAMRYEARTGQLAREIARLREQVRQQDLLPRLLRDPATRVVALTGLDVSPGAQGRMIWHEREGGVFFASNLPPVPRDRAYELWIIADGHPLPAGVFTVDVEGHARLRVDPLPGGVPGDQFAVTLEPAAGAPGPTGPMYLASKGPG
jgi:anti-sigma-K factor RskA